MGIFGGGPSQYENDVEKATSEKNTTEEWGFIMSVCDNAGKTSEDAKNFLRAILKRLSNSDPHIAIQAVTLLDACAKNSGRNFRLELASREFENEYQKLLAKSHPKVVQKLKESLRKWAEDEEFKNDPQLNLIPSLYANLKSRGVDFTVETPVKKTVILSKDPNVVQSQEEEDQIAKAIEMSLKETSSSPRNSSNATSLYPSTNLGATSVTIPANTTPQKEPRKVRALYDFEAAEDNELTFSSGEIIVVIDDSDPNWWKGSNQRGDGLFPANFVTTDLNVEPEQLVLEKKKKLIELDEDIQERAGAGGSSSSAIREPENVEINEEKVNRLLHLLHEADPTNPEQDTLEMLNLEREVNGMGPLIDAELERVDRKHAQLTQLSSDLVEALSLYHTLMREPQFPSVTKLPFMGYQPGMQPPPAMYNGSMPPSMGPPGSMMGPSYNSVPPGHERQFIHQQNMHPHFPLPPQGMHPSGHQPMTSMPSMMQSLPPGHSMTLPHGPTMPSGMHGQQDIHRGPPPTSIPGHFPPPGLPNFVPGSIPVSFPPSGPHLSQTQIQNGPPGPQSTNYPQSNSHMM